MDTTDNFGIAYPTGPDDLTPLQAPFAVMAGSVDAALLSIAGQSAMLPVQNTAERDEIFTVPQQGNSVFRIDKGWMEVYYGAYNSATNPGGTVVAGWYPVFGKLPRITMMRMTTDFTIESEGQQRIIYNGVSDNVGTALSANVAEGRVTAVTSGRYRVVVSNMLDTANSGYLDTTVRRNGTSVAWNTGSVDNPANWYNVNMDVEVLLTASQYIEIFTGGNAAPYWVKARESAGSYYSVQYVSPPFPNNS